MTTTGCATAGSITFSPMKQLHALHPLAVRSSPSMPLTHPCKLVFLFWLPTRLNPITSIRHRLPLAPPFCGHGELEIVSVKELADGFLHFSFGTPNANKVDKLASSCGELLAGKVSVPRRLPSKFSKKSPIPVAAAKRRRKEESSPKEGSAEAIPSSVKEAVKLSSRPKSSFFKRSPIPRGKSEHVLGTERVTNGTAFPDQNILTSQGTKVGSMKAGPSMRPTSKFVRKSPIPTSVAKHSGRHGLPSADSIPLPDKASNAAFKIQATSSEGAASRPTSNFLRRSPIVKVQHLSPKASSTRRQSSPTLSTLEDSSEVDDNTNKEEASAKRPKSPEGSPHLIADLEKYKLPELKNLAKMKGVKGYYKLKKGELLDLLKNLDS